MLNVLHSLLPDNVDRTVAMVLAAYATATSIGGLGAGIVVGWVWGRR